MTVLTTMMSLPGPPSGAIFSANPGCIGPHQLMQNPRGFILTDNPE